uniref:Uncharacterized protein n=1 Tax=Avena sativa TaxID=4498 RepID=A0ACD5VKS7_AVESA
MQALLDTLARRLATWQTLMLTPGGRLILVKTVLSAITVYYMLSLDLPPCVLQSITKICRAFLLHGTKEANGGHWLVSWSQVCEPTQYGGPGIHNLKMLNDALRMRWRWLDNWLQGLQFKLSAEAESMFKKLQLAVSWEMGSR